MENEYGFDISGMKAFYDAETSVEIPMESLSKDQIAKILGGVPIVRCSVCKHALLEKNKNGGAYWCEVHHGYRAYNEFCNRGERL